MLVRLYSDLHREFDGWEIPALPNEEEMVVVLAGDIAVARKHSTYDHFLVDLASRHRAVVYVPGNHEYYGSSFDKAWADMKETVGEFHNLYMLDGETVRIDDVLFIGATLWTNFDNENPLRMAQAAQWMNDYRAITRLAETDDDDGWMYRGKLQPHHTIARHKEHVRFIINTMEAYQGEGLKTFVVTHHGPTLQSIDPRFIGDELNAAYVSDLTDLIRERGPDVWVHGHTHHTCAYVEGNTHIFTNPKGYPHRGWGKDSEPKYENADFREDGFIQELNNILAV